MTQYPTEGSAALQPSGQAPSPRLVSLAILKANWNDGRSYLDNFVPFVAACLREEAKPMTVKQVQTAMRKMFGIRIPQHALETVLKRAGGEGLVTRRDGLFHPDADALAGTIAPSQGEFLRCHTAAVEQLREFAGDRYGREFTAAEAAAGLDSYAMDFGATIIMQGAAAAREFDPAVVADPNVSFIVHAFVEHLAATDPAGFGYLSTVVEGSMLASVVYLDDVGSVQRKFKDSTTVYLDTPFLLRALGHLGPELAAPANELLGLLRDYGARIACFDKTVTELRGVLLHASRQLGVRLPSGADDVLASFAQRGLRRADVELIAAGLETELRKRGIDALAAPPHSSSSDIDETELERVLNEDVRYWREPALRHDLDALTAVDRLRRGRHQPILEHCRAIFLTTNAPLVGAARRYFDVDGQGFNWPPAILDTDLATLLWLKQPRKSPDLPRKQIMADCYAALRPNAAVWDRWIDEIARTEAAGGYSGAHLDYIRFSPDAQRMLMDITLGDASAIESETVELVVAAAEKLIVGPVAEQLDSAQTELEEERRLRLDAEARVGQETQRVESEALARRAAQEAFDVDRQRRRDNLDASAGTRAHRISQAVFAALMLTVVASFALTVAGFAAVPGPHMPLLGRVAAFAVWLVSAAVGLAGMGWGVDARRLVGHVEKWLHPRLLDRYLRRAGDLA